MKTSKPLTIVIKLGSSSIVDERTHEPLLSILSIIVETAVKLRHDGHRVIIVSSGAIAVGLRRMEKERRPKYLPEVQALAAIGQCRLISLWDSLFAHLHQPVAQILLTRNDIADRTQYLNAQNTLTALLEMGVIPIVNENDTLAVSEIKFGDNDTLSAITAAMVHADYLFLMTDVDCLYDKNPRTNSDANAIEVVENIDVLQADVSSAGSSLGTGGMSTKIVAARLATSAGVTTIITKSSKPGNIVNIVRYIQAKTLALEAHEPDTEPLIMAPLHTRFLPSSEPIRDRSFWLLHGLAPHGTIYVDAGAHRALISKAGLLPVGVVDVEGSFAQQECVRIVVVKRIAPSQANVTAVTEPKSEVTTPNVSRPRTPTTSAALPTGTASVISHTLVPSHGPGSGGNQVWDGTPVEVGRALVNYSAVEIARVMGAQSSEIHRLLGYADSEYIALRENISCFKRSPVVKAVDAA